MKAKKITKPELEGDTYLIAQAVNNNAEVLEDALNRIKALEREPFRNAYIQVVRERYCNRAVERTWIFVGRED